MSNPSSSYKQTLKATSIFGGVQVFNILTQLIRSKAIAVFLGPAGVGIMGLLQTVISLISSATNFGLGVSAVRDISEADSSGNQQQVIEIVSIFRKLVWLTGTLGMVVTAIFSPLLSKLTFGNYNYTWGFIWLASTVLLTQLATGQLVLLQGLRKINWLAKANVFASVLGLLFSLPLYYFYGNAGIIPALIITAVSVLMVQFYFANKVEIIGAEISFRQALQKGKGMLKLGFLLSLSGLISVAASYIIRLYISRMGGVEEVGFYSAGFTIVSTYVGLVFAAMGTDYYPQLAAVNTDIEKSSALIQQQAEIALIILAPLICIFMVFIDGITVLMYTKDFLPISAMVHWAMLGIFFKAVSWSISFLFLAKADSKTFFWNEMAAHLYLLIFNIAGYYYFGLAGLGISFLLGYFIYLIQVYLICKIKYKFHLNSKLVALLGVYIFFGVICFFLSLNLDGWKLYTFGGLVVLAVTALSFVLLNRRVQIYSFLKGKMKK